MRAQRLPWQPSIGGGGHVQCLLASLPPRRLERIAKKRDEELKDCFVVNESKESKENKSFLEKVRNALERRYNSSLSFFFGSSLL